MDPIVQQPLGWNLPKKASALRKPLTRHRRDTYAFPILIRVPEAISTYAWDLQSGTREDSR